MTIAEYQKKCFNEYKKSIRYPEHYSFYYGNPINPLVPVETAVNGAMVVGPYPSARFYNVNGVADVPLYNNDGPFPTENYFDGLRRTEIKTGSELNNYILRRIGLKMNGCWVTNLVKVFLFKKGHIDRLHQLGKKDVEENKSKYADYAKRSITWLEKEIEIAQPYVVILLGADVAAPILGISEEQASVLINGMAYKHSIGKFDEMNVICLPHPTSIIRRAKDNDLPERYFDEIAPKAKDEVFRLKKMARHAMRSHEQPGESVSGVTIEV
jgi:uracil-DNA glycosylase